MAGQDVVKIGSRIGLVRAARAGPQAVRRAARGAAALVALGRTGLGRRAQIAPRRARGTSEPNLRTGSPDTPGPLAQHP